MKASETNVACPSCGAQAGAWCVRHGVTMQGTLGSCADRTRMIININTRGQHEHQANDVEQD